MMTAEEARAWLIAHDFDPSDPRATRPGDLFRSSSIIEASSEGSVGMLEWLFKEQSFTVVDVVRPDGNGNSACFWAAKNGHIPALNWLYHHGAARLLPVQDRFGVTPLYISLAKPAPQLEVAKWLILHGGMTEEHSIGDLLLLDSGGPTKKTHVTRATYQRAFSRGTSPEAKEMLLRWALQTIEAHETFVKSLMVVRRLLPVDDTTARGINMELADYLEIERGETLRFLREFISCASADATVGSILCAEE